MDLEKTEARYNSAGEGQQQFNWPTELGQKALNIEAEESTLLGTVTKQRLVKT
jgi:hypothetical protein